MRLATDPVAGRLTMRTLVLLLVLANLALFGYAWPDRGAGESTRLAQQVQPDKIRLLSPQQVAALGPAKVAALADVCLDWGPFTDAERTRALADLEAESLGKLLTTRRIEVTTAYWVFVPPFNRRSLADKRLAELQGAGIENASIVDTGGTRFTIALGAFAAEDVANAAAAALRQKGVKDALVGPRQQTITATQIVIRDPGAGAVARVRGLLPAYRGTDIRIGPCESGG